MAKRDNAWKGAVALAVTSASCGQIFGFDRTYELGGAGGAAGGRTSVAGATTSSTSTGTGGGGASGTSCIQGVCTPGGCRSSADCNSVAATVGEICGATTANVCGRCTSDAQCQAEASYSTSAPICNIGYAPALPMGARSRVTCALRTRRTSAAPAVAWRGNCCQASDCPTSSPECQQNQCTACPAVTNNTYYVDPVAGVNTTGNGSSATGGNCEFRTITKALAVVGLTPPAGTKIEVLTTGTAGSGETFPMVVPPNVTIEGAASGTPSTINLPADTTAFWLTGANSGLNNLVIDGGGKPLTAGIVVHQGTDATTTLTDVTIQNMGADGISAGTNAVLTILSGVSSSHNLGNGLIMVYPSTVTITVNAGETAASFSDNSGRGIDELGGSLTIGGRRTQRLLSGGTRSQGFESSRPPMRRGPT